MKKMMATMLGATLALGSATMFAQEGKTGDTSTGTTKTAKAKRAKKHGKKKAAAVETAPAAADKK